MTVLKNPTVADLKIGDYKIVVVDAEKGMGQDLSQLVTSVQWDYDLDQPAEHYTISFAHTQDIAGRVKPGDKIKLYAWAPTPVNTTVDLAWKLLKRIYVSATELSSDTGGNLKATGYNIMWYLMRNTDTIMLDNETASQFITRTAAYFGIPLGKIEDTQVMLTREPFINRTLWDMWVTALSYTRDMEPNARYLLQENEGKIDLINRVQPASLWEFRRGVVKPGPQWWNDNTGNIFAATNNFSMEQYINVVRIYKGGEAKDPALFDDGEDPGTTDPSLIYQYPPQAAIESGVSSDPEVQRIATEIQRYGMFTSSVDLQMPGETALNLGSDDANAEQQGQKLFKKLNKFTNTGSITTFNVNNMGAGDPVILLEEISGLRGKYFVKSGTHVVSDTESSMTLTVNIEDALPEAYQARRQEKKVKTLFDSDQSSPGEDVDIPATGEGPGAGDPWTEVSLVTAGFTPAGGSGTGGPDSFTPGSSTVPWTEDLSDTVTAGFDTGRAPGDE